MKKRVFIGLGIIAVILFLFMIAFFTAVAVCVGSNNKCKGSNEEILAGRKEFGKKALIIYQPNNMSTKTALKIAKGLNDGGYEVTLNYPGKNLSYKMSEYSVIVFGSPIYAGQPSRVLTDYMSSVKDYSTAKIALFSVGMLENKGEFEAMEKCLNGKKPYVKVKFRTQDKMVSDSDAYKLGQKLAKD